MRNLVILLVVLLAVLTACGTADKEPEDIPAPVPQQLDGDDVETTESEEENEGEQPVTEPEKTSESDQEVTPLEEVNQKDVQVAAQVADIFYSIQAVSKYYEDGVTALATIKVDPGSMTPWGPGTGLGGLLAWILEPLQNTFPNSNGGFVAPSIPAEFQGPIPSSGAMAAGAGSCPAGAKPDVTFETEAGETVTSELIQEMDISTIPADMLLLPQDGPGSLTEVMNDLVPMGDHSLQTAEGWNNLLWESLQEMQTDAESLMDYQMWNDSGGLEEQIIDVYRQQLDFMGVPDSVKQAFEASNKDGWYSGTEPTEETALGHMDISAEMTGSVRGTVHEERDFHIPGGGEEPEFGVQTGDGTVIWEDPDLGEMAFNVDILLDQYDEEGKAIGGNVVAVGAENGYTVNIVFQPDGSKVGEVYKDGELVGVMNMSVDAEQFENYVDIETEQTVQMPTGSMYYK